MNYLNRCVEGEEHAETWCNRACSTAKFVLMIKNVFDQNFLIGPKKEKHFFISDCLKEEEIFIKLYNSFFLVIKYNK